MSQLSLFDQPSLARKSDPQTSQDSAAAILPKLSTRQAEFMRCLKLLDCPSTAQEVAAVADVAIRESVRKRAAECVRLGLAVDMGTKFCSVTKQRATVYWVKG